MPKITLGVMVIGNPSYIYKTNDYEYLLARFRFLLFDTAGVVNKEACSTLLLVTNPPADLIVGEAPASFRS